MNDKSFDTILENGTVYDGTGRDAYPADVGIVGDRIESIGRLGDAPCAHRIDAAGLAVAPGFIDLHTHSDFSLVVDGKAESQVHQGVTTEVIGQCGHSAAPVRCEADGPGKAIDLGARPDLRRWSGFGQYLDTLGSSELGVNVAAFVGHGAVHHAVMGDALRLPEPEEVEEMASLVRQSFEEGAAGLSTGLEYWPGSQSTPDHVTPLVRVAAEHERLYATHVRNRDRYYDLGFGEAIATARAAGARLQISHIQPKYGAPDHAMDHTLELVASARRYGLDVAFDIIPHDWSHTRVMAILPRWALEGGAAKITERLKDPAARERIKANRSPMWLLVADRVWSKILLLSSAEHPELVGASFEEIGRMRGVDPYDAAFDLLLEEGARMHQLAWTSNSFRKSDLELCLRQGECAVISDTQALAPHGPLATRLGSLSGYGWTSEFLGHYVDERGLLSLPEAVRRMTSLPAERLGVRDRGVLREGLKADITVFRPGSVRSRWTVEQPRVHPEGIRHVFVNGRPSIANGERTAANGGVVLRGPFR